MHSRMLKSAALPRSYRHLASVLCLLIVAIGPAALAWGADPVQVTTLGGYGVAPSRDGAWLAFRRGGGIAKIREDGSDFTQITTYGSDPHWGRSGNLIVFADYQHQLFTLNAVTAETTHVWTGCVEHPAWSPISDEIAVQCPGLAIVQYPHGPITPVPCGVGCADVENMGWSPDGQWLVTDHRGAIWKVSPSGGAAEILAGGINSKRSPNWSPDGRFIVYAEQERPVPPPDGQYPWHVWVVDARGESHGKAQITFGAFLDFDPAWSADGATIYFDSNRTGSSQIWKVAFDSAVPASRGSWGSLKARYR